MAKKARKEVTSVDIKTPHADAKRLEVKPKETQEIQVQNKREPRTFDYLVVVDGFERYLSADAITVALQRGQQVEIPKGSKYVPPAIYQDRQNCKGCGR